MKRILSGVIVSALAMAADVGFANAVDVYSFESSDYRDSYVRHKSGLGEIAWVRSDSDRMASTFRVVRGLAGRCSSFESVDFPGHYLRHQNFQIKLHKIETSELFKNDATFCFIAGLDNPDDYSFESLNYPEHYIQHRKNLLFIGKKNGAFFNAQATFIRHVHVLSVADGTQAIKIACPPGQEETTRESGAGPIFTGCKAIAGDAGKPCKVNSECQYGCGITSESIERAGCHAEGLTFGGKCPGITGTCTRLPGEGSLVREGEITIHFIE